MSELDRWRAQVDRCTRLRWAGVLLFGLALVLAGLTVAAVARGEAPAGRLLLAFAGAGLALGTFGTADDTALAAMFRLAGAGALPPRWSPEYQEELRRRPDRPARAHASPRAALIIPLVDLAVLSWLGIRLWGGA